MAKEIRVLSIFDKVNTSSPYNGEVDQSDSPETISVEHETLKRIGSLVGQLTRTSMNESRRTPIAQEIISECRKDISLLYPVLEMFGEYSKKLDVHSRYVYEQVVDSKELAELVAKRCLFPPLRIVYLLLRFNAETTRKPSRVFQSFFRIPSQLNSKDKSADGISNVALDVAFDILQKVAYVYVEMLRELSDSEEKISLMQQVIAEAWKAESRRDDRDGNLYQLMYLASVDAQQPETAETAYAAYYLMFVLEMRNVPGATDGSFAIRDNDALRLTRLVPEKRTNEKKLKKLMDDEESKFSTFLYDLRDKNDLKDVNYCLGVSRFQHVLTRTVITFFIDDFIAGATEKFGPNYIAYNLVDFPDGGAAFIAYGGRGTEKDKATRKKRALRKYIPEYFSKEGDSDEVFGTERLNKKEDFFDGVIPRVDKEYLKEQLNIERKRAQGGFNGISKRGKRVVLLPQRFTADEYLSSMGIRSLVISQSVKEVSSVSNSFDGFNCSLTWFNIQFEFKIDSSYHLIDNKELSSTSRMWIEHLLLTYIAEIKHLDRKVTTSEGEDESERLHPGTDPHLRVLPAGHQNRQIDFENTDLTEAEDYGGLDKETYISTLSRSEFIKYKRREQDRKNEKVALVTFGVSLYTLNRVFHSVQEDPYYLTKYNLLIIIQGYEDYLPRWRKMTTDIDTLISIIERAEERKNQRMVEGDARASTPQGESIFFSISSVKESLPDPALLGVPVDISLPNASEKIATLST